MLRRLIPTPIKSVLRKALQVTSRATARRTRGYTLEELDETIRRAGLQPGDTVMVHSGMRHFKGIKGSPEDVIDIVLEILGPRGNLLMPSMPFRSTAYEYIKSGAVTDIRSTPSAMGLITETFRRRQSTTRSLHPTHPILAIGPDAQRLLADHPRAKTPCGVNSPFDKLRRDGGKILLLGVHVNVNTLYHYTEEILEADMPPGVITSEALDMPVVDDHGERHTITNRLYDPEFSRRRDLTPWELQLRRDGNWREATVGELRVAYLSAEDCVRAMASILDRDEHCYNRPLTP